MMQLKSIQTERGANFGTSLIGVQRIQVESYEWVNGHVEYIISARHGANLKSIRKRFSEIRDFNHTLSRHLCSVRFRLGLAATKEFTECRAFPLPIPLTSRCPCLLSARAAALQDYFDCLVAAENSLVMTCLHEFLRMAPLEMENTTWVGPSAICDRGIEADFRVRPEVVGKGSNGPVHLAEHRATGRKYVVKTFQKKKLCFSYCASTALRREVELSLTFNHAHILPLESVYESSEHVCLVFEYLEGGDLLTRVQENGRVSEDMTAGLISQILHALSYLHSQGLAHGDIKPDNAVFAKKDNDHLMLIDFGMVRRLTSAQPLRGVSGTGGTLGYEAPEVWDGDYTDKSDMWSLGIMSYALMCGCLPWRHTGRRLNTADLYFDKELWGPISDEGKSFVTGLLQDDPRRRPNAAIALTHPWLAGFRISDAFLGG